jgi:hypothetical protein
MPPASNVSENHTAIISQLNELNENDDTAPIITLHLEEGVTKANLQGNTLDAILSANASLIIYTHGGIWVELPTQFIAELRLRGSSELTIYTVNIEEIENEDVFTAYQIIFTAGNINITNFVNNYYIFADLSEIELDGLNLNRITAIYTARTLNNEVNTNIGGKFNEDNYFVLSTSLVGSIAINYVEDLVRLNIGLDTYTITDTADNVDDITMDVLPIIQENRTLLPVRFMAYALGASVNWNEETSEVTLGLNGTNLTFAIGETVAGMDIPAQIINDRTMVPLRFISEFFGANVEWDENIRTIEILK